MSKSLKIFLGISYIIILFIFLFLIFSYIELSRLDDFSYYKELQFNIEKKISQNIYLNVLIFFYFLRSLGFFIRLWISSFTNFRNSFWKMVRHHSFCLFYYSWSINTLFYSSFFFRGYNSQTIGKKIL